MFECLTFIRSLRCVSHIAWLESCDTTTQFQSVIEESRD